MITFFTQPIGPLGSQNSFGFIAGNINDSDENNKT